MNSRIVLCFLTAALTGCSHTEQMNISCFAYRDINRNGYYDLEDRPYSGLKFTLDRPDGKQASVKSNIAGFANFVMSPSFWNTEIFEPGKYIVTAKPNDVWLVTSGNRSQELPITKLDGSPGGLIAEETLIPVGIAPILTIAGELSVPQDEDVSGYTISARFLDHEDREIRIVDINLEREGFFSFPAKPGRWSIEASHQSGRKLARTVTLAHYPVRLSRIVLDSEYSSAGQYDKVIDFDGLTTSDTLYEIPNAYGELQWYNWVATHQKFYGGQGYINSTTSGEYVAYNSSGHPASISSEIPFDFIAAQVGVAWGRAEKGDIYVTGWRDDKVAYRDRFRAKRSGPLHFAADYKAITKVEFSTEKYWQVVLDDVRVRTAAARR
jgi:hypothetical protein